MAREDVTKTPLPPIPAKRYFTIGEVSELCAVKPHVLRYWEQEFTQLKPVKRRGNRRFSGDQVTSAALPPAELLELRQALQSVLHTLRGDKS